MSILNNLTRIANPINEQDGYFYDLKEVQRLYTTTELLPMQAWIAVEKDEIFIGFVVFTRAMSVVGGPHLLEPLWQGNGTGEPLRELRHSTFGDEDGYVSYVSMRTLAAAIDHLKQYFDGD